MAKDLGDVIVVGAGPVGFLTSLGLARRGIRVTLLEAESGINSSPRAAIYFPTTLEIIDKLGLLEDAEAIGLPSTRFSMRFPDTGEVIPSDLRNTLPPGSKYDHNLHFGQHILAGLVSQHLARLPNAQVLWSHRVVALSQDKSGVTLGVETPDGSRELHADWVIGTDGARSAVRTLLGLPFEGHTWPDRFVATNVEYDFEKYGFELANMIADPVNWAVVARLGRENLWRVTYGEDAALAEDQVYARIPEHYAAIFPGKEPYRIVAWSPYRVQERCAPSFRVGRALLAGDAAHACNPCGGLGLTTGVIDADALISVMAAVIEGKAGDPALDFYAQERKRVFHDVTSPLATNFKRTMSEKDPAKRKEHRDGFRANAARVDNSVTATSLSKLIFGNPMPV
jgi:2-polyprenyl-6-methoxyphenol hydroxylase-like FAD-dependent oxidoreductase